jgi:hypothetical protein
MKPSIHLQRPAGRPRFTRTELARMFWRAAYYLRRQRPRDEYSGELLEYVEREFRTMWRRPRARDRERIS